MKVTIYTIDNCYYCKKAKQLLTTHGYNYTEKLLEKKNYVETINSEITKEQRNNITLLKAPQILFDQELIGGFTDLSNKLTVSFTEDF